MALITITLSQTFKFQFGLFHCVFKLTAVEKYVFANINSIFAEPVNFFRIGGEVRLT